jgi:hypothetical protein
MAATSTVGAAGTQSMLAAATATSPDTAKSGVRR